MSNFFSANNPVQSYVKVCSISLFILLSVLGFHQRSLAETNQQLAFSSAKGFGKYSQGGKGGKLYIVTSLDDNLQNPSVGSLRYAIKQKHARIIEFAVSGVIKLNGPLKISHGNVTLSGESSPGGITLAGAPVSVSQSSHVIIRYLRFRLGTFGYADDALSVRNSEQIIIDHCSFSWSVDETASFYNNRNFTLQNSIIANSLNHSIHPKGEHGYGGIWGGANASFINNIVANHASRTPRINGHRLKPPYPQQDEFIEIINNIFFNWGHNNVYGSENGRFNLINNYYKPGLASKITQIADIWYSPLIQENQAFIQGNFYEGNPLLSKNNWQGVNYRKLAKGKRTPSTVDSTWLSKTALQPLINQKMSYEASLPAVDIFNLAIKNKDIGANQNKVGFYLDSIDSEIYLQLQGKAKIKNKGLINHEFEQIGSWEVYENQFMNFSSSDNVVGAAINDKP